MEQDSEKNEYKGAKSHSRNMPQVANPGRTTARNSGDGEKTPKRSPQKKDRTGKPALTKKADPAADWWSGAKRQAMRTPAKLGEKTMGVHQNWKGLKVKHGRTRG